MRTALAGALALSLAACGGRATAPAGPDGSTAAAADAGSDGSVPSDAGDAGPACPAPPPNVPTPTSHRPCALACAAHDLTDTCKQNSDCTDYLCHEGRCTLDECFTSSDCDGGKICTCAGDMPGGLGGNVCSSGTCHVDSDCGDGGFCSPSWGSTCGTSGSPNDIQWHCHTPADSCRDDADCDGGICLFGASTGAWACTPVTCCGC